MSDQSESEEAVSFEDKISQKSQQSSKTLLKSAVHKLSAVTDCLQALLANPSSLANSLLSSQMRPQLTTQPTKGASSWRTYNRNPFQRTRIPYRKYRFQQFHSNIQQVSLEPKIKVVKKVAARDFTVQVDPRELAPRVLVSVNRGLYDDCERIKRSYLRLLRSKQKRMEKRQKRLVRRSIPYKKNNQLSLHSRGFQQTILDHHALPQSKSRNLLKKVPKVLKNNLVQNFMTEPSLVQRRLFPVQQKLLKLRLGNQMSKSKILSMEEVQTMRTRFGQYHYKQREMIGKGTFGVVYKSRVQQTGQIVAVKKVFLDKNFKHRELQIMSELNHPNVIFLRHSYQLIENSKAFLHLVMEYFPDSLIKFISSYEQNRQMMDSRLMRSLIRQLISAAAYIHSKNICHRDLKPHNILIDPEKQRLVICDFGSAKKLMPHQSNVAYICSRCYRAPELIFGANKYSCAIDMWSIGCIIAEMINGQPLFVGESNVGQLIEIIKVLGTPSIEDCKALNPDSEGKFMKLPNFKKKDLQRILRRADSRLIDLLQKLLIYNPKNRLSARQALSHVYFCDPQKKLNMSKSLNFELS